MNEERAREILKDAIDDDRHLYVSSTHDPYVSWHAGVNSLFVTLEGIYSLEYLRALVWWMENKGEK